MEPDLLAIFCETINNLLGNGETRSHAWSCVFCINRARENNCGVGSQSTYTQLCNIYHYFVDLAEHAKNKKASADAANATTTLDPSRCESCYGAENSQMRYVVNFLNSSFTNLVSRFHPLLTAGLVLVDQQEVYCNSLPVEQETVCW